MGARLAAFAALGLLGACSAGDLVGGLGRDGTGACVPPATVADRDVARHAAELSGPGLCIRTARVSQGGWQLSVVSSGRAGPLWVVPHDDEDSGFDGALAGLLAYGGTLVAVEAGEQRLFRGRDPNRAFGAGACAVGKGRGDPAYTRAVLGLASPGYPIVAVHSNARRTVSMRRPYRGATAFPATTAAAPGGPRRDDATMMILAGDRPAGADPAQAARIAWFNARGVNVLYETVSATGNDCSLTNHAVLARLGPTYTVEVHDGDSASARALVRLVAEHAGLGR